MKLTEKNFKLYAMQAYDNPYCLSEDEFLSDLGRIRTIKKMITHEANGNGMNTRLLVNHFISFFNVFKHIQATEILFFRLDDHHKPYANAILTFLNLPIGDGGVDEEFYDSIDQEYAED